MWPALKDSEIFFWECELFSSQFFQVSQKLPAVATPHPDGPELNKSHQENLSRHAFLFLWPFLCGPARDPG